MKMSPVTEVFVVAVVALVAATFTVGVVGWSVMLIVSPFHSMPWRDAIQISAGVVFASIVLKGGSKRG